MAKLTGPKVKQVTNPSDALRFDEGEALLGKRTNIKDSSDRYANIELAEASSPPKTK